MSDPAFALIGGLFRRHTLPISFTYTLTLLEKILQLLFPWATGVAIDSLLGSDGSGLWLLCGLWLLHLVSATGRKMYDTRLFTRIYTTLATGTVLRQRAAGDTVSAVAARSALSRECIDFVERDLPQLLHTSIAAVGSVAMLFYYSIPLGWISASLLLPAVACNGWFALKATALNRRINDRLEREVQAIEGFAEPRVRRHFSILRRARIRLSDAEAISGGLVELFMVAALAASLIIYTRIDSATPGMVYAVFVYLWTYFETLWVVPSAVNAITRVRDIGSRLHEPIAGTTSLRDRAGYDSSPPTPGVYT